VEVTLAARDGALELQVQDDGRGFDQAAAREGYSYGLLGMTERARLIGGSLRIDSRPGEGTTVSIHIPLESGNSS
jgi:signal transduction histidine kinase